MTFDDAARAQIARGWLNSSLDQPTYAAEHGISDRTLREWLAKYGAGRRPEAQARAAIVASIEQLQKALAALDAEAAAESTAVTKTSSPASSTMPTGMPVRRGQATRSRGKKSAESLPAAQARWSLSLRPPGTTRYRQPLLADRLGQWPTSRTGRTACSTLRPSGCARVNSGKRGGQERCRGVRRSTGTWRRRSQVPGSLRGVTYRPLGTLVLSVRRGW